MSSKFKFGSSVAALILSLCLAGSASAEDRLSRSTMWASGPLNYVDTTAFKKEGPYTIGISNASVSNLWALGFMHSLERAAEENKELIKKIIVIDANDNPTKQVSDIQDLMSRNIDILIVRPATEAVDGAVLRAIEQGIPVVFGDRRTPTNNYTSFVTADGWGQGRAMAQWLVEKLGGKGNIVMLSGGAGASPAEIRAQAAMEVFQNYPDIKVLDRQYTDWSPAKGKTVMAALMQKYGTQINGIWADHGLQASGAIEAYVDAGVADGNIPPVTCADLNACWVNAISHKVPMMSIDNPPAMGATTLKTALDILQGRRVLHDNNVDSLITVTKGDETTTIKADMPAEDYARMDASGELILSTGIPNYDPNTFTADYPK